MSETILTALLKPSEFKCNKKEDIYHPFYLCQLKNKDRWNWGRMKI